MKPQQQTWDTRAWLTGIVGGAIGGGLMAWSIYPSTQDWLNTLPHFAVFGSSNGQTTSTILGIIAAIILPGVLSGIARRRTFVWGLLPIMLFLAARDIEDKIETGSHIVLGNLWFSLLMITICLVSSSGPVSLIRWLRVRAARQRQAAQASFVAMREAASVPQEGVWPPPPDYKA